VRILGLDGVDARVDRELEGDEHHDDEGDVGRRAVPRETPLVALLALGDRLDVRAERVRQVVRLDDEAARLDDLALDLRQLLVRFPHLPGGGVRQGGAPANYFGLE
jgi:hypothetical protein